MSGSSASTSIALVTLASLGALFRLHLQQQVPRQAQVFLRVATNKSSQAGTINRLKPSTPTTIVIVSQSARKKTMIVSINRLIGIMIMTRSGNNRTLAKPLCSPRLTSVQLILFRLLQLKLKQRFVASVARKPPPNKTAISRPIGNSRTNKIVKSPVMQGWQLNLNEIAPRRSQNTP